MGTRFRGLPRFVALASLSCLIGWGSQSEGWASPQMTSAPPRLLADARKMAGDPEGLSGAGELAANFPPARVEAEVRLGLLNVSTRRVFVNASPMERERASDTLPHGLLPRHRGQTVNLKPVLVAASSFPASLRLTTQRIMEPKPTEPHGEKVPVTQFQFQVENLSPGIAEHTVLEITIHGAGQINAIFPNTAQTSSRTVAWDLGDLAAGEIWRGRFETGCREGVPVTITPRITGGALSRFSKVKTDFRSP